MSQEKATLIYVGDPMCSWCYGFANEISAAVDSLENDVKLELIMGGLRPYGRVKMNEISDFLREHWEHIEAKTGQSFSYDILQEKDFVYNTEIPCRAVVTVEKMDKSKSFAFFKAIQKAFYAENKNTNETETYIALAESFDLDGQTFKDLFESEEMKKATRAHFDLAANMGVSGFPTLILQIGEQNYLVSNGYTTAENITEKVGVYLMEAEK